MLAKDWWKRTERVVTEFVILYQHFSANAVGNLHLHSRTPGPGSAGMQRRSAAICRHALVMLSHDLMSIADHESSTRPPLLWQLHCSVIGPICRPPAHNQTASEGVRNLPDLIINLKCGIVVTRTNGRTQRGIRVITINQAHGCNVVGAKPGSSELARWSSDKRRRFEFRRRQVFISHIQQFAEHVEATVDPLYLY
jgi:hypothetical protein